MGPVKTFAEALPFNARVTVDHRANTVNFDYPDRSELENKRFFFLTIFFPIMLAWFLLLFAGFLILGFYQSAVAAATPLANFDVVSAGWSLLKTIGDICGTIVIITAYPLAVSLWIAYNYDRYKIIYPKFNHAISKFFRGREFVVHETSLDSNVFEIPLSRNVILDYKLKGEFADYIDKVRIEEHPFKKEDIDENGKTIRRRQDYLWRAIFTFSQPPKKGYLRVNYI